MAGLSRFECGSIQVAEARAQARGKRRAAEEAEVVKPGWKLFASLFWEWVWFQKASSCGDHKCFFFFFGTCQKIYLGPAHCRLFLSNCPVKALVSFNNNPAEWCQAGVYFRCLITNGGQ